MRTCLPESCADSATMDVTSNRTNIETSFEGSGNRLMAAKRRWEQG